VPEVVDLDFFIVIISDTLARYPHNERITNALHQAARTFNGNGPWSDIDQARDHKPWSHVNMDTVGNEPYCTHHPLLKAQFKRVGHYVIDTKVFGLLTQRSSHS